MEILVRYGYAVVFGTVLGEQIGLPIPAIPVMLAAGALVGGGHLNLMLLLALSGVASLMADTAWYWIGRAGGARVLGLLCRISLERDTCVRKTEGIFARHGARSLLIAKFIPGFSTIAPPLAGVVRMPFTHFLFFSGLGGLFWSGVFHRRVVDPAAHAPGPRRAHPRRRARARPKPVRRPPDHRGEHQVDDAGAARLRRRGGRRPVLR